jgi:hypothetical protein
VTVEREGSGQRAREHCCVTDQLALSSSQAPIYRLSPGAATPLSRAAFRLPPIFKLSDSWSLPQTWPPDHTKHSL